MNQQSTSGGDQGQEDCVARLHAEADRDYAAGQQAREGLDRAERHRTRMWGEGQ
jgi:hypothetical protein